MKRICCDIRMMELMKMLHSFLATQLVSTKDPFLSLSAEV